MGLTVKLMGLILGAYTTLPVKDHQNMKKYCDEEIIEKELEEYIKLKKIKKMSAISNLYVLTDPKETD